MRTNSPYVPALDGIRAAAVLAVIAFHSFNWLPGGFYGVDTFFVLSGYLITNLLVNERTETGHISLARFWMGRARRLLPALFTVIAVVAGVAVIWPAAFGHVDFTTDAAAAFGYVANWYFLVAKHGYFGAIGPPSPLLHTWSLAIEEQFYLLWPIVVLLVRRVRVLLVISLVGAGASAIWMALLGGTRAYYGTDTRSQALLIGAALALVGTRWRVGWLGVLGTAVLWSLVSFTSWFAFHGGFLLAAVAAAAVISGVLAAPDGTVARTLSKFQSLGRISYGVYLWYWPVLLVMRPTRMHANGGSLFIERLIVTIALASVSAWLIELPFRRRERRFAWAGVPAILGLAFLAIPAGAATVAAPQPRGNVQVTVPGARPVKVLLVGDSIAGSLGVGLSEDGVTIENEGTPGCSLSMDQKFKVLWYTISPGPPCRTGTPRALLAQWQRWVNKWNPDVVVYLARGELFNQEIDGHWGHLGTPTFDHRLAGRLAQGIAVLHSRGAPVVLLSSPYYSSGTQPSGAPWPEDVPGRVTLDRMITDHIDGATVVNFGELVSPGNKFAARVDGVPMRCADGVHFTAAGGRWVGQHILPTLIKLGQHHAATSPGGARTTPPPVPKWWKGLPCT